MVVPTVFELNSVKDQIALIKALTSHIDFEKLKESENDPLLEELLSKLDHAAKNLTEKYENLKNLLDN